MHALDYPCRVLRRTTIALLAGVVLALAFEPYAVWPVVPFAIAAYVACVRGLPARRAWLPGLAFGVGFMFVLIFWMRVVGWDAWVGLALLEALFLAALGSATALVCRLPGWPVWAATAWVACEVLRSSGVTGWMPWGRVSYAMVDTPVAQAFPYVGGNGVSFLLALVGATLLWALLEVRARPRLAVGGVVATLAVTLGPALVPYDARPTGSATVAAVQGDVPGDGSDILLDHEQVTRNHIEATLELASDVEAGREPRPDFVVWPENSTAVDPFEDRAANAGIDAAAEAVGVPLLVGVIVDAPQRDQVLNQGIVWTPGVGAGDRYTKRHPVAMGEYVPYRNGLLLRFVDRLALVPRDMVAGTRSEPLDVGGIPVGDAICFDVAYDDGIYEQVERGAQLLVVQTSNAIFIHTNQIEQQFAITRLRALETGRALVVASPNGRTGIIGADGQVVSAAEPRSRSVLVEEVALHTQVPPAVRIGPWVGRLALGVTGLALLVALLLTTARSIRAARTGRQIPVAAARSGDADAEPDDRPERTEVPA